MDADAVLSYLRRRAADGPWSLDISREGPFPGGVVVPSLAESASLPALIDSLLADHTLPPSGLVVVFVVNNRDDATLAEKEDNRRSLGFLRERRSRLPFPVGIVDAASDGLSLPNRDGGVGLARKIGHDLLLPSLDYVESDPVIVSLDADTIVDPGYAGAIMDHFRTAPAGGGVIPYAHQQGASEREEAAIIRYELFLRCYVAGLAFAGSPYAFHTVGSAMACRASAYLKCGGMNRRRAGEDFYFLQSLAKSSGVGAVRGAMVRPSPRRSGRVPFGTGRAMTSLLDGHPGAVLFHRQESFCLLRRWLALAAAGCRESWPDLAERGGELSPHLHAFLCEQKFPVAWSRFLSQQRDIERRLRAFHGWFDAFRTMKFFHFLADGPYPRSPAEEVVSFWPELWGEEALDMVDRLALLRRMQMDGPFRCDYC